MAAKKQAVINVAAVNNKGAEQNAGSATGAKAILLIVRTSVFNLR